MNYYRSVADCTVKKLSVSVFFVDNMWCN